MRVGIFDSGIGGLKIARGVRSTNSEVKVFYISDYAYSPYGDLSLENIISRSRECVTMLLGQKVSVIIIACNTATAAAISELRQEFTEITFIGVEPDINFVNRDKHLIEKCCVMTTPSTALSNKFKRLIQHRDPSQALTYFVFPKLATLIEKLYRSRDKTAVYEEIKKEIDDITEGQSFSHVVLGCTHYGLIEPFLSQLFNAEMICPAEAIVTRFVNLSGIKKSKNFKLDVHYLETTVNNWQKLDLGDLDNHF